MLYVTTRNEKEVYTANHALTKDCCICGGRYVPYKLQAFSAEEIAKLAEKSFGQCVADILNLFFSTKLDGVDVDFCIGKNTCTFTPMSHKIVFAECWHNPEQKFQRVIRLLSTKLQGKDTAEEFVSDWTQIAVRIACLFALYGELLRSKYITQDQTLDVSVVFEDFPAVMAVWYARKMGLPVHTIICASKESDVLWELVHQGQVHTDHAMASDLERLIYASLGAEESARYGDFCAAKRIYQPSEEQYPLVRNGMFAAVVSEKRIETVIGNLYRSASYLVSGGCAAAFSGLQDYRASTGEGRMALVISEECPVCDMAVVTKGTGLSASALRERYGSL